MRPRHLFLAAFTAATLAGACGGKPSPEDCKKFADHYVAVMSKDDSDPETFKTIADGMKPNLIADCEKTSKAEIDCIFKANTMEEIRKCDASDEKPK